MITIYDGGATDFSTQGLGVLVPISCTVNWEARGMYDLSLVHPVDDEMRWSLLDYGRIIKAPAPVREAPIVEAGQEGHTVTRQIYRVTTSGARLRMRAKPSLNAKILSSYKIGTEVERVEVSGSWARVIILNGGATGWMWNANLTFVRTETETIVGDKPSKIIGTRQIGNQLFRITDVERDATNHTVAVTAMHISYDLRANSVKGEYSPEKVTAATAVSEIMSRALAPHEFDVHCYATGQITGEYGGRSIIDCLLNPDDGIVKQLSARLVRDNYDIYILPDAERDTGVQIRYAKNLLAASLRVDAADIVTRIEPVGKDKDGKPLYIAAPGYVDSPIIGDYPHIGARRIEYDVQIGKDDIENATQARAKLIELANADYATAGVDLPSVTLDVDFVALGDTAEYADYKDLQAVHPYDTVSVEAPRMGISAKVRLTKCTWDSLAGRYTATTFGDIMDIRPGVQGYDIARGAVVGSKLGNGAVDSGHLRSLAVRYAHIDLATIDQLTADSIVAVRAFVKQLAAEEITTDELYAAIATIAIAQITTLNVQNANIAWADIETLTTRIATIANAEIGTANIDWAQVKDLIAGTAIFTEGVGGKLFMSRLSVTEANMVNLTVGQLVVRGDDGAYYRFNVNAAGTVSTTRVQVANGDIVDRTINAGEKLVLNSITADELNATSIFADSALIREMIAANIDVDTLFARLAVINQIKTMTVRSVEDGSTFTLSKDGVNIETPRFSVNVSGAAGDMTLDEKGLSIDQINSPSVSPRYFGPATLYVVKGATDAQVESGAYFRSIASAFAAISDKRWGYDIEIRLNGDTYYEGILYLRGVTGGRQLSIVGNGSIVSGMFLVQHCLITFLLSGFTISQATPTSHGILIRGKTYVAPSWIKFLALAATTSSYGAITVEQGGDAYVTTCEMYGAWRAILVRNMGEAVSVNNKGDARLSVTTGRLTVEGTQPCDSTTFGYGRGTGGVVHQPGSVSVDMGTATPPEPEVTTQTFSATTTRTVYGSAEWPGSWMSTTNKTWQGYTSGNGRMATLLWFAGLSALAGKTIRSARLRMHRNAGSGKGSAVNVVGHYGARSNSAGSGSPSSRVAMGTLGNINEGDTKYFDIPVAAIEYLAGDSAGRCIALHPLDSSVRSGKSYSTNYCKYDGVGSAGIPVLEVTYEV